MNLVKKINLVKNKLASILWLIICYSTTTFSQQESFVLPCKLGDVDSILSLPKDCVENYERVITYIDTVEYLSEVNRIVIDFDTLIFEENQLNHQVLRTLNKVPLERIPLNQDDFTIENMELVYDMNELNICRLASDPQILIIEIHPMNWVGIMSKFAYIIMINKREKCFIEIIYSLNYVGNK